MNPYFFPEPQRGVPPVDVPGLARPVYATPYMAAQLLVLVRGKQPEAAYTLIKHLGGMQFQP
jgi:hypothetical protein